ncbi:MAG TPA: electron transfer flavoprotein subunit alpha/FixB family protein [Conexivisphaerales archaeon]|nr:electron transfer flavoprotein subunit alpha/FixB family protein [Conexivisphaerales archaeon]
MVDVLFYSEDDELLHELTGLATALAAQAGGRSFAVVLGDDKVATASSVAWEGASEVYLFRAPAVARDHPEAAAQALAQATADHSTAILLVGSTKDGKVVAGRLAAALGAPAASDCASVQLQGEELVVERPSYGGRVKTRAALSGRYVVACVKPRAYPRAARSATAGKVTEVEFSPTLLTSIVEVKERPSSNLDLTRAERIVSVGRGLKKKEDLLMIQGLADIMGASVGCSRPLSADLGWLPEEAHIGLTGIEVRPKIYLAIGISGQLQHMAGVKEAGTIVAINTDKGAPIFANCDYGMVGDLYQVVPELKRQLAALKNK